MNVPARVLDADELYSIKYFWETKGDPTRYCYWESLLPELENQTNVPAAWRALKAAELALSDAIDGAIGRCR